MSSECSHLYAEGPFCIDCGATIETKGRIILPDGLSIDPKRGAEVNLRLEGELMKNKKLALIVDLDQTLIHTTHRFKYERDADRIIAKDAEHADDFIKFTLHGNMLYVVRIRPHIREFLEAIYQKFDMYVCTLAERAYALQILKKIDPENKYFHQRAVCRDDGAAKGLSDRKPLASFFPFSDRMALVLDDREDVWRDQGNRYGRSFHGVVQLERFVYWQEMEMLLPDIWPSGIQDKVLLRMKDLLLEINKRFYQEEDFSEKHVLVTLSELKRTVFEGCYIYLDSPLNRNDPEITGRVKKLSLFGGNYLQEFTPYCTHVVAWNSDSPIIQEAMKYQGIFIVSLAWLDRSYLNYHRMDEMEHGMPGTIKVTQGEKMRMDPPAAKEIGDSDLDDLFSSSDDGDEDKSDADLPDLSSGDDMDLSFLDD